jgi:hypothetical protein
MGNMDNARKLTTIAALSCLCACGSHKIPTTEVVVHDTIYTERVISDTIVVSKPQDTIVMEKERLRVRVVRINDTLRIEGECAADTIYRTTTIEVPVKVVESRWPWWAKPLLWALFVLSVIYTVKKALSF